MDYRFALTEKQFDGKTISAMVESAVAEHYTDKISLSREDLRFITLAIMITENSPLNPYIMRFENTLYETWQNDETAMTDCAKAGVTLTQFCTSYSLMQILYSTAFYLGFDDKPEDLLIPETNINYGVKNICRLAEKYPDRHDIFAAYNAGTPIKRPNGDYANQKYVTTAEVNYSEVKAIL